MPEPTQTVSGKALAADIRAGLDDATLREKYSLSPKALQSALNKLLVAGLLTEAELDARGQQSTGNPVWICPACKKPQPREFPECPQCGVLVAKFKEKEEIKARNGQAARLQEQAKKSSELEQEKRKAESSRRAALPTSALTLEHRSIPVGFKKELYPGLVLLVAIGTAIARIGSLLFVVLGLVALVVAIISKQLLIGIGVLLGSLLLAGLTWLAYKTYAEGIQICLDISTSLVKNNLLLARILEKDTGQSQ